MTELLRLESMSYGGDGVLVRGGRQAFHGDMVLYTVSLGY